MKSGLSQQKMGTFQKFLDYRIKKWEYIQQFWDYRKNNKTTAFKLRLPQQCLEYRNKKLTIATKKLDTRNKMLDAARKPLDYRNKKSEYQEILGPYSNKFWTTRKAVENHK